MKDCANTKTRKRLTLGKKLSPRDIEKVMEEGMKECIEFIGTFKGQNGEVEIPTSLRNKERANTSISKYYGILGKVPSKNLQELEVAQAQVCRNLY
ncbi:hypothetical protein [Pyrococcus kukulkanii]|uniref:Uncharacterized protein n=1 Tax=Pyrococcus kukulkanii TaxID=1609559 RepID=A0A127B8K2_9EURY|nr:hypothetical protein [Pyrococcus kukulkanii]AMM53575.1 hypothetical protein TQ32_03085 [Pyrococcus kukulkanii]